MTYRIGIDIGGTFTDFALFDDRQREIVTHKSLTTPAAPDQAVLEGVATLTGLAGIDAGDVSMIVHGTTLVTNAVIERRGSPTAMVVTRGFRDVLDIAMEQRYDLFDLRIRFPAPLVPRSLRFEVDERIATDGSVRRPLVLDGLAARVQRAIDTDGVRGIAVCLLHSYANPTHELALVQWLESTFPDLRVSASSVIFPFAREYSRWTTACLNAYVQPVVDAYVRSPRARSRGCGLSRAVPDHELERQHADPRHGPPVPGPAARVRPGRGCAHVRASQPLARRAAGAFVRHGRHDSQGLRGARARPAQAVRDSRSRACTSSSAAAGCRSRFRSST